jgi:hypothetical protein
MFNGVAGRLTMAASAWKIEILIAKSQAANTLWF